MTGRRASTPKHSSNETAAKTPSTPQSTSVNDKKSFHLGCAHNTTALGVWFEWTCTWHSTSSLAQQLILNSRRCCKPIQQGHMPGQCVAPLHTMLGTVAAWPSATLVYKGTGTSYDAHAAIQAAHFLTVAGAPTSLQQDTWPCLQQYELLHTQRRHHACPNSASACGLLTPGPSSTVDTHITLRIPSHAQLPALQADCRTPNTFCTLLVKDRGYSRCQTTATCSKTNQGRQHQRRHRSQLCCMSLVCSMP